MSLAAKLSKILESDSGSEWHFAAPYSSVMRCIHGIVVFLLLFPRTIHALIAVATMLECCEVRRGLREIVELVSKKKPIVRDKFFAMTFTK